MKEIYLIRHGQTEWNKLGKGQGKEANIPLNDNGREQAFKTGQYLLNLRTQDKQFTKIYSSPMSRTAETAEIIKTILDVSDDITYDDSLVEYKHGKMSGLSKDDPLQQSIDKFIEDFEKKCVDPIDKYSSDTLQTELINKNFHTGIETNKEAEKRVESFIKKLVSSTSDKIIVVGHGGTLFALIRVIFNLNRIPLGEFIDSSNCFICYITHDIVNKKFKLISPPNNEHLALTF